MINFEKRSLLALREHLFVSNKKERFFDFSDRLKLREIIWGKELLSIKRSKKCRLSRPKNNFEAAMALLHHYLDLTKAFRQVFNDFVLYCT